MNLLTIFVGDKIKSLKVRAPGLAFLFLSAILYLTGCSTLFYFPDRYKYSDPKFYDPKTNSYTKSGQEYFEIEYPSLDGKKLGAWYFPKSSWSSKNSNPLIVHFHGNAQNISAFYPLLSWTVDYGFNYFIWDYPGYGLSEGEPNPQSVQKAAFATFEKLESDIVSKKIDSDEIIIYGQSLGGAIALGALSEYKKQNPNALFLSKIKLIVIECSFLSYKSLARKKLASWWLTWPFQWMTYFLLTDSTSARGKLDLLKDFPLLLIHGDKDVVVPLEEGLRIYDTYSGKKELIVAPGLGHLEFLDPKHPQNRVRLLKAISPYLLN